jgi:hypothetical protein
MVANSQRCYVTLRGVATLLYVAYKEALQKESGRHRCYIYIAVVHSGSFSSD